MSAAMPTWPALDIGQASSHLAERAFTAEELVDAHLARMEHLDRDLHAVVTSMANAARGRAREIDLRGAADDGLLTGIPIGIKDNFETAGVRTTVASRAMLDHVPQRSSAVVERLERAGAIPIAKLNMDELALGGPSGSDVAGVMVNPWDNAGSPGGSSGGSAIGVAASYCMAATGSDTGGSIRNPAGWCGVAGFRPTQGAISIDGIVPVAWSLDAAGMLARTVADCARLFAATADRFEDADPAERWAFVHRAQQRKNEGAWRVAIAADAFEASDAEVRDALAPALEALPEIGTTEDVRLPSLDDAMVAMLTISTCEVAAYWAPVLELRPDAFGPEVRARLDAGVRLRALDYLTARRLQQRLRTEIRPLFDRFDAVVMPTMGFVPRPDPFPDVPEGPDHPEWRLSGGFTSIWSLTGNPVISVPGAFSTDGRPLSLQLVGPLNRDGRLLQFAAAAERMWALPRDRLVPTWVRSRLGATA